MSSWLDLVSRISNARLTVADISLRIVRALDLEEERAGGWYRVNAPVVGDIGGRALGSRDLLGEGDYPSDAIRSYVRPTYGRIHRLGLYVERRFRSASS